MTARAIGFEPAAVLLDMDGLMLDSERVHQECWREAAKQLDLEADDDLWMSLVGMHEDDQHDLLCEQLGKSKAEPLIECCDALFAERIEAGLPHKSGLVPLLEQLAGADVTRAVVTSSNHERAWQKLETAGLQKYFDTVITGSDIDSPKPAPDIYRLAAERLGVDPERCIVLEDSEPGVRAALAAGMHPIQVPDLIAPDDELRALGYRIVESLAEASELIGPRLGQADAR
ncbi:HAD family hydrolase [Lysobacter korlensis]|uniref:HAD family hydrolase n=1 Tax=Lysobacter korlensis TaxID=553636 RepID=A0ABV6RT01_9GAMM